MGSSRNDIICGGLGFTHVKRSQVSVQGNDTGLSFPLVALTQNFKCFSTIIVCFSYH